MVNYTEYSDIVDKLTTYYGNNSQQIWNVINSYDLTPAQAAELLPKNTIAQSADGVYRIYNNAGEVSSYVQQASVPTSSGNVAQSAINSNVQNGTASTTVKTKFAGNSVIDQNGKVKTSSGVTKYENGSSVGSVLGVVGNVVSGVAAAATGISLGKKIDSALYNANPTFWNSLGLDTLNPATWNSITANMSDTGTEGALKTAINFIFGLDSNGNTQAYMSKDAYEYLAYALASKGAFDTGGQQASSHDTTIPGYQYLEQPFSCVTLSAGDIAPIGTQYYSSGSSGVLRKIEIVTGSDVYHTIVLHNYNPTRDSYTGDIVLASKNPFTYTAPNTGSTIRNSYTTTVKGQTFYVANISSGASGCFSFPPEIPYYQTILYSPSMVYTIQSTDFLSTYNALGVMGYVMLYGTITQQQSIEGLNDQTGATIPTGINSSSTQQDVADYITNNYSDLYDNRIEQTVVQEDGTTKTVIYYPVPFPNTSTNSTTTSESTVTTDTAIDVILPSGSTIQLPDGTTVTGDGVSRLTLPKGTYTLPSGTTIINNPVSDDTNTQGSTQNSTEVTSNSTNTLLQTIINILTNPKPQELTETDTSTENPTEDSSDVGDGTTPTIVIPTTETAALFAVYNPSKAELNAFGQWLWSNNFIDQLLKMFNDPMQAIIGLHKTYIQPATDSAKHIYVGYLDSGVSALTVPTQYTSVDCGSVNLSEYFGNVFDYAPYTRVYIYLPFIGFKELDVSQVMRSKIGVKYYGDAYTGACLAEINVTRDAGAGGVLYSFAGECAVRYPLSQGSYMGIVNAIAGLGVGAVGALTGAGGLGAVAGLSMMQHARTNVEHSGSFSGNAGAMGIKKPYLVIMRPQTAMANNYRHFSGSPSNSYVTISETSGLIRVREYHIENITYATKEEKEMIGRALTEGIIVS